ncbi:hypothetical protein D210916BOD24_34620 [Alteromonas sp. D210916BOD_24]
MKAIPTLNQSVSVYGSQAEHETMVAIPLGIAIGVAVGIYLR